MDDVENSQEQLAAEYVNQKGIIKELMNDNKKLFKRKSATQQQHQHSHRVPY